MNAPPFRLPTGGHIDRATPVDFTWNGRALSGCAGDTLASALLANGVHFVARSFKYHRPRGIVSAGSAEPNALVTLQPGSDRHEPNARATCVELHAGLRAISQNHWPSLGVDLGAASGLLGALWPAGFYYKTFMWPRGAWRSVYEPLIRRAAGSGHAPAQPDPDRYAHQYAHCDVLVVGGGPAGMSAALAAADSGAQVMLVEELPELGGSLLHTPQEACGDSSAFMWRERSAAAIRAATNLTCLTRTTAFGIYPGNHVALVQSSPAEGQPGYLRQRHWQVHAKHIVLATGALERPMLFSNNDRPGIMLADAARAYLNRFAVAVGSSVVVYASHDSGYASALDLQSRTGKVRAIVDPRRSLATKLAGEARAAGIEVLEAHEVRDTRGGHRIRAAVVAPLGESGGRREIRCDTLLMAGGWTPSVHLFSHARGGLAWDAALQAFVPGDGPAEIHCAGGICGSARLAEALSQGERAGAVASSHALGLTPSSGRRRPASRPEAGNHVWPEAQLRRLADDSKVFVDLQHDVCASDIALAIREGFEAVEHLKRYTTTGMATDQGKNSNVNALLLAAALRQVPAGSLGTTTFRPPFTPVTFGALAAEHRDADLDPVRHTPSHAWASEQGAVFEPVALWLRARYFPRPGESMHAAVERECRITRECAGIFDASTLGKIEVVGPDAAEFLDRLYTNSWSRLEVGRCRYGIMLREDGFVFDDGVVGRIAADRFHVTTTTSGAPRVLHHMEDYLQTEFPELRVWLTSTTEQWAVFAVNGPRARDILAPLVEGIDLTPAAFPHMAVREGRICGVRTRLFRVSFTGELGFEVNVPTAAASEVWAAIQRSGAAAGAVTYGTETMHVLRAEKGYILVGQETDGTVTPRDLGLDWAIGKSKPDFVGKRSLARADLCRNDRKQLVGLLSLDGHTQLDEGAQVLETQPQDGRGTSLGFVTSSYHSVTCGRPIALALVAKGRARVGTNVHVTTLAGSVPTQVVAPVFYDSGGERLHG